MHELTSIMADFEEALWEYFGQKPSIAVALAAPPDYNTAHWLTNVTRSDGIELFERTAAQMRRDRDEDNSRKIPKQGDNDEG